MALDKIAIINEALAEVPAEAIASLDEESAEAEWSARRYSPALAYLLEQHDWKFANRRAALAPIANDRDGEWTYCYALPPDCAAELRVFPSFVSGASVPLLAGQFLAPPTHAFLLPILQRGLYPWLLADGRLYTTIPDAVLEYVPESPSEAGFSAMFTRALSLELASRLVMPLKKDRVRQGDLIKMAENARDRAIADMRNRDPSEGSYEPYVNESELARGSAGYGYGYGYGYPGYWVTR